MKILGFNFGRRTKAAVSAMSPSGSGGALVPASSSQGFLGFINESFAGAWQRNIKVDTERNILAFSAVFACVTLIASDIGKLRVRLIQRTEDLVWEEVEGNSPFWPVLTKPNHYQNRIQFYTQWMVSKLLHGNTYVLKQRDARGVVTAMYILDPRLVVALVSPDGSIFYQLATDQISELPNQVTVPASEIVHDRMPSLWHPLLGVSPIYACGASATQGIRIQNNSNNFFENMSRPSGMLTAPGHIPDDLAARLKAEFSDNFSGAKIGKLAVLGDGLKYEAMTIPAADAQLIEQLKWTVEDVARCFHVPLYMLGTGQNPTFQNIGALTQSYYTQTLQVLIESMELGLTEGFSLPTKYEIEFDLDPLLRMDPMSRYDSYGRAIGAGWMSPNEARQKENMNPVEGGDTPYMQQQNWSLAQLNKRTLPPEPGTAPVTTTPELSPPPEPKPQDDVVEGDDLEVAAFTALLIAKFAEASHAQT